jgi:hypothetical protein
VLLTDVFDCYQRAVAAQSGGHDVLVSGVANDQALGLMENSQARNEADPAKIVNVSLDPLERPDPVKTRNSGVVLESDRQATWVSTAQLTEAPRILVPAGRLDERQSTWEGSPEVAATGDLDAGAIVP